MVAEDEVVKQHQWFTGHEFEQTPGDSEGQGSLECCSSWGCQESDMTCWLNNTNSNKLTRIWDLVSRIHLMTELSHRTLQADRSAPALKAAALSSLFTHIRMLPYVVAYCILLKKFVDNITLNNRTANSRGFTIFWMKWELTVAIFCVIERFVGYLGSK